MEWVILRKVAHLGGSECDHSKMIRIVFFSPNTVDNVISSQLSRIEYTSSINRHYFSLLSLSYRYGVDCFRYGVDKVDYLIKLLIFIPSKIVYFPLNTVKW